MTNPPYDPAKEGARMSFVGAMSYGDYLCLEQVLGAQKPKSKLHDELLFIIQHQTSELWMKLAIHEISTAIVAISKDGFGPPSRCWPAQREFSNSSIPPGMFCAP